MKAKIIQAYQGQDFHKEVQYIIIVLGQFQDFDNVVQSTQKIALTFDEYAKYKPLVGKEVEIDVVFPVSKYPLALAS